MRRIKVSELMVLWGGIIFAFSATSAFVEVHRGLANTLEAPVTVTQPADFTAQWTPIPLPTLDPAAAQSTPETDSFLSSIGTTPAAAGSIRQLYIPERIVIRSIELDAPVVGAKSTPVNLDGQTFQQWQAPDTFAAGWFQASATLGVPGNTVLDGHHNVYGEVFRRLVDLNEGDLIDVYSADKIFIYQVTNKMILKERDQPLSVRIQNAQWIEPSNDERLTLITCWPYTSNTHRLIIVAAPLGVTTAN
jgi:LPXTG-site transpeptidase (sortase) family protein